MGQDYFTYVTFLEETEITEDLKEVLVYENGEDRTMAEEQSEEKIEKETKTFLFLNPMTFFNLKFFI